MRLLPRIPIALNDLNAYCIGKNYESLEKPTISMVQAYQLG